MENRARALEKSDVREEALLPPLSLLSLTEKVPQKSTPEKSEIEGRGEKSTEKKDKPSGSEISQQQAAAVDVALQTRAQFVVESENKPLPADKWQRYAAIFKQALVDAESVKADQLLSAKNNLNEQFLKTLRETTKNNSLTSEQATSLRNEALALVKQSEMMLAKAVNELSPEQRAKFDSLEKDFASRRKAKDEELRAKAELEATGKNETEAKAIQEKYRTQSVLSTKELHDKLIEDCKALSPELKAAYQFQSNVAAKPETSLALTYSQLSERMDSLKFAPELVRLNYALALGMQGDTGEAKKQFEAAMKNPSVGEIIETTPECLALAEKLGIKTPGMKAREDAKAELNKLFPELKQVEDALKLMDDSKNKNADDQKRAFADACKLFDSACASTGRDNRKVEELRDAANKIKSQLELAEKDIASGKRQGLTESEKEQLGKMQVLLKQADNAALVRYQYALMLNGYGHANKDEAAKAKAIDTLNSIKDVDRETFAASPEIAGALKQANDGRRIDPEKAAVEAFIDAANEHVSKNFPELKNIDDAEKLIAAAREKSPEEQKKAFEQATKLFEQALATTGRPGRKVEDLRTEANAIKLQLVLAQKEISDGKRADFTAAERESFDKMHVLLKQADSVAIVRYRYAIALNEFGHNHKSEPAKAKSIDILKSIKDADPSAFNKPEVQGALKQATDGKKIAPERAAVDALSHVMNQEKEKFFPESAPLENAVKLIAEAKDKPAEEQKRAFAEACKLFDRAVRLTDREERKVEDLRAMVNTVRREIQVAERQIKDGVRKDFTAAEKERLQTMEILSRQAENVGTVRYLYALELNKFGHDHNDAAAKAKAIKMLESIEVVDRETFSASPEIQGALSQARNNKKINTATTASDAFIKAAKDTVELHSTGLIDWLVPAGSATAQIVSGNRATELPVLGPVLFGGGKDINERVVNQLAQAYLANPEATEKKINESANTASSDLQQYGTDVLATGVGLATKYGANHYLSRFGTAGKVGAFALGLGAAGLTKDVTADGEIGTGRDWLRGGGVYGVSLLALKGMSLSPNRAVLTTETLAENSARLGVEGLSGSGRNMAQQVWAARAALREQAMSAATQEARQAAAARLAALEAQMGTAAARAGNTLNPMNYTPIQLRGGIPRWVGMGGETTAAELAAGRMSWAEYNARRGAGHFLSTAGSAFGFGAGREAIYIGTSGSLQVDSSPTGLNINFQLGRRADGSEYTFENSLADLGTSGLHASMASSIMLPISGSLFRSLGFGPAMDGAGRLAASRLGTAGAIAAGDALLLGTGAGFRKVESYNTAMRMKESFEQAKQRAEEAKEKARKEAEEKEKEKKGAR